LDEADIDDLIAKSEVDSVDQLMLQQSLTNMASRNKFKIDYSQIKTNRINLNRIDLNDERYELKKIKKIQDNMSLRKLSGNNLDK